MTGPKPCGHWDGQQQRLCGATENVRLYLSGHRCPEHTPARLAGHAEPPVPPKPRRWYDTGLKPSPLSASWLHDRRAVESGRRVSGERRRAAHAGEAYDQSGGDAA